MNKLLLSLALSAILLLSVGVYILQPPTSETSVSIVETSTGYTITSEDNSPTEVIINNPEYQVYALKHYSDQGVLINTEYITADEYELRFNISHWSYYTLEGLSASENEIVSSRTINSKTIDNQNGTNTVQITMHSQHYLEDKILKDINLTINNDNGIYKMEKAGYNFIVTDDRIRFIKNDDWIEFTPIKLQWYNGTSSELISNFVSVIPIINNNKILWENAFGNNIDLEYGCGYNGIYKYVIINDTLKLPTKMDTKNLSIEVVIEYTTNVNESLVDVREKHENNNITLTDTNNLGNKTIHFNNSFYIKQATFKTTNISLCDRRIDNGLIYTGVPYSKIEYPLYIDTDVNEQIGASTDDGIEKGSGELRLDYSSDYWGQFGIDYTICWRWTSVAVPNSATIESAVLSLYLDTIQYGTLIAHIQGIDEDNTATWSDASKPSQRSKTTASIQSNEADWDNWGVDNWITIDISSTISEITSRAGWSSDNALAVVGIDDATSTNVINFRMWDYAGNAHGAKLNITYSVGGDTTLPTYSNNDTNTTTASASCNFTIDYNDDTALHTLGQYKFSTNNSGAWLNSSLSNFTSTPQTIYNNTLTLNNTVGAVIGYRWYADDNAGNVNNTPIYTLTITNVDPAISFITPPTPVNDSTNTTGEVYINVSVSDPYDDLTAFVNWNESLVGWWTFNDESLVDLSGYNNNGTFYGNNSENWTVGKFGDSANFSRINKTYVGVGNDSSLYPGDEFTVDLWIKPDPDQEFCYNATLNHGNYGIIALASDPWSSSTWSYQLRYGSADNCSLGMQVNTGLGSKWVTVGYNLSTTESTHIVVTFNSTKLKLYVNKTLTDTESYTSTYIKNNTNNEFMIGIDGWGNSGTLYSGSVDDVKLWNRAISHDEVNSSYDAKTYDLNITYSDLNNGETYNFIAYVQDEHGAINETEIRYVDISTADDTTFTVTLPVGYTQMNFTPSGHSDKNETPGGQTSSVEFYNVTNNGNVNLDIKLKYNTSVSTITLKVDTDNNPVGATTITTSLQVLQSSLGQGSSCDLWFWTDFTQSVPQTTYRTIEVNVSKS